MNSESANESAMSAQLHVPFPFVARSSLSIISAVRQYTFIADEAEFCRAKWLA